MAQLLRGVKGMNDILPPEAGALAMVRRRRARADGSLRLPQRATPMVEPTALFVRGLGEVTDIVEKEMYSFVDSMNGDGSRCARRHRGHRACGDRTQRAVQRRASASGPSGPMFRHERPQKGRYRQFHQVGVEALGYAGPDVDAELILMGRALWRDLGLSKARRAARDQQPRRSPRNARAHRDRADRALRAHADRLDDDAQRRLHSNPLRILDTKNPAMQAIVEAAPKLMDFLGAASLRALRRRARAARRRRARLPRSIRAWCAAWTTTT